MHDTSEEDEGGDEEGEDEKGDGMTSMKHIDEIVRWKGDGEGRMNGNSVTHSVVPFCHTYRYCHYCCRPCVLYTGITGTSVIPVQLPAQIPVIIAAL